MFNLNDDAILTLADQVYLDAKEADDFWGMLIGKAAVDGIMKKYAPTYVTHPSWWGQ